ncbi:MAG: deoxyribonuclease IV [Candidatus Omnitrophica bacterium]|nr:deoxyribonuclease IV [Candidatus Omnitrophota bacterium]
MLLGVHVSIAGGIAEAVVRAVKLGCTAIQIFPRDPRQWRKKEVSAEQITEFRKRLKASPIKKVFLHQPYLINLASGYNILYRGSVWACIQDIKLAAELTADFIVVHMGSHKGISQQEGLRRIIDAVNKILDKTRDFSVGILLENTSGSGSWLGYKFEHQQIVLQNVEQKNRLGFCLDTCHAYTAGYDLSTEGGYNQSMLQIEETVGLERIRLVHLNDSPDKLGSRRDRHQHIGKGRIGLGGFSRLVNDHRLKDAAFILETPKDSRLADKKNLQLVKQLLR